jgi:hypothetical protein
MFVALFGTTAASRHASCDNRMTIRSEYRGATAHRAPQNALRWWQFLRNAAGNMEMNEVCLRSVLDWDCWLSPE